MAAKNVTDESNKHVHDTQGHTCKCGAKLAQPSDEAEKGALAGNLLGQFQGNLGQPMMIPHSEEMASAAQLPNDRDHNRKVRINKDALKKRAQSAKHKVKVDPTRDNYKGPTRWLADSAFTTYYGKPVFHQYGRGNVKPTNGGNYMLSHNVNPESQEN